MISTLLRLRVVSFGIVLVALITLMIAGKHVRYEQSLTSFFPSDDPAVIDYARASRAFGNDNVIFISYDDPDLLTSAGIERVAELAALCGPERNPAVVSAQSLDAMPLFWQIDDRLIDLQKLPSFARAAMIRAAKTSLGSLNQKGSPFTILGAIRAANVEKLADLREKITRHPLLQGTVVSSDGRSTAVVVQLKGMAEIDPKATVQKLRQAADGFAVTHHLGRPALVGPPVLLADGFASIEVDGNRLSLAGMAMIGLVTLSATRSLWWAIVPILSGWTVWLAAETVLALLGLKLSLSGGPLVAQIIVLTMPAASHLAIHFRDDLRQMTSRRQAAERTLRSVTRPILWCAATGAIGYAALLTSNVMPVFQFGGILAICTLLASILTYAISPLAMLPPFRMEIPVRYGSRSSIDYVLNQIMVAVVDHPASILVAVVLVVAPLAYGMTRIEYESNYINAFDVKARVVQDYHATEERLGGIGVISLVVPAGKDLDPDRLRAFAQLDDELAKLRRGDRPAISRTISLATVLDPDHRLLDLPSNQAAEAVKTKLDLIAASPQANLLNSFWNREEGAARVLIRMSERQDAIDKKATFDDAVTLARSQPAFGANSYVTGLSFLLNRTTEGVIATQKTTILWSVGGILIMLTLAFRSPILAVLAILPTILAVALVLGLMGWLGIKLDVGTALVASVALGLSVDDTFHCLLKYQSCRRQKLAFRDSLFLSYAVTGPGVLLSSFAVAAGFAVLWFSEFVPFSNFGMMVGIATLGSSLGNLVFLPACLALGNRFFGLVSPPPETR